MYFSELGDQNLKAVSTAVCDLFPEATFDRAYQAQEGKIIRKLAGHHTYQSAVICPGATANNRKDFDWHWLRAKQWPEVEDCRGSLGVVDMFCGAGGLSLGAWEAARAVQLEMRPILAIDNDPDVIAIYREHNFSPAHAWAGEVEHLLDGDLGSKTTDKERRLCSNIGQVDLLLAGPPCQGHSDLNNYTRRRDPRNELLLRVVRFAELVTPTHILIENVQGVRHDQLGIFALAKSKLAALGYYVTSFLLEGQHIGLPQRRRRCFLVASRSTQHHFDRLVPLHAEGERSFDWACSDLEQSWEQDTFNTSARVFPEKFSAEWIT